MQIFYIKKGDKRNMEETKLIECFKKSEVNKELLKLYESKWDIVDKVHEVYDKNKVYDPHTNKELSLVFHSSCVPHHYERKEMAYKKILMIGQETNGWVFRKSVKDSMLFTLGFLYSPQHNGKLSFTFPFDFCKSVNNCDYDENYRKTYFAWVSLRKFAYNEKHAYPLSSEIQNIIDNEFNILEEEIKIINPDIVLFLTGPDDDFYIEKQLKSVEFKAVENYDIREFARVEHEALPKNSFRIYHPNRIRFIKEGYKKYLASLKKECGL